VGVPLHPVAEALGRRRLPLHARAECAVPGGRRLLGRRAAGDGGVRAELLGPPVARLSPRPARGHNGRMDTQTPPARWYHRPFWVVVMLFVVIGPFGLPLLWKSPSFSRNAKIVLTVAMGAYLSLCV